MPNFGNSNADPLNPLMGLVDDIGLVVTSSMALILAVGAAKRHHRIRRPMPIRARSDSNAQSRDSEAPRPLDQSNYGTISSAAQHKLLRRTIDIKGPLRPNGRRSGGSAPPTLIRGFQRICGRLAGALAKLLGLLRQRLHLGPDVGRLQLEHLLEVLGAHQLLREVERGRDVLLDEAHRLPAHVLSALAGRFGLPFQCADGALSRRNEAFDGLLGLLYALLGDGAHLRRNLKLLSHGALLS